MVIVNRLGALCFLSSLLLASCIDVQDTFRSTELISAQGEKIYINTLNWGMTDDNQYTIISKDQNRLKNRKDTVGGIKGLVPFVYKFSHDTLYLFFPKGKMVDIEEKFHSVQLHYIPLENREYMNVLNKAGKGEEGYWLVP